MHRTVQHLLLRSLRAAVVGVPVVVANQIRQKRTWLKILNIHLLQQFPLDVLRSRPRRILQLHSCKHSTVAAVKKGGHKVTKLAEAILEEVMLFRSAALMARPLAKVMVPLLCQRRTIRD